MTCDRVYVRGLKDIAACETKISFVDPSGVLYYSGYDIDKLIGRVTFEEVTFLLLNKKLPNRKELENIKATLFSEMKIPIKLIQEYSNKNIHPMKTLLTTISSLGESDYVYKENDESGNIQLALRIIAQVPTIVANIYRMKNKQELICPKKEYGFAENFLFMFRGKTASVEEKEAIERFMILYADHGLNTSTFSARITASTLSDIYSGVTSAIGTLGGELSGGASERVMGMLLNVGNSEEVKTYVQDMLCKEKRIIGFGHGVYNKEDPRSKYLRKISKCLCLQNNKKELYYKARAIQYVVHKERKIFPNVSFYAALVLNALGVPKEFFASFFASSRTVGWTAHILEQYADSVLLRPTSKYIGAYGTKFISINNR